MFLLKNKLITKSKPPNFYKYFSLIYPFLLTISNTRILYVFDRSLDSYASILLIISIFLDRSIFKIKDRVLNKYYVFWIYFLVYILLTSLLSSISIAYSLDIGFITSVLFLIAFSYTLSSYPILINLTIYSYIFSFSLLSIFQNLNISNSYSTFGDSFVRIAPIGFNYNEISAYYCLNLLILIYLFINKDRLKNLIKLRGVSLILTKVILLIFFISTFFSFYKTGSRSGLLAFALGLLLLFVFSSFIMKRSKTYNFYNLIFLILSLFCAIYFFNESNFFERFQGEFRLVNNRSFFERYTLMTDIFADIARDNLFFGTGKEGIINLTNDYFGYSLNTHSAFLDVFAYSGLIGIISFLFFLISLTRKTLKLVFIDKDIFNLILLLMLFSELFFSFLFQSTFVFFLLSLLISGVYLIKFKINNYDYK